MSDENRNEDGTFAGNDLPLGGETLAAELGYVPMDEPQEHPEAESDLRTEAARLAASREPADPIVEVQYQRLDTGEKAPENETISLDRAAADLGNWHAQQDEERARSVSSDFAKEIDKLRADAIKDPKAVAELGLDAEAVAAAKQAAQEAKAESFADIKTADDVTKLAADDPLRYLRWEAHQNNAPDDVKKLAAEDPKQYLEATAFDSIEGLEPELKEVLKKSPQARAFLEQNATEAEQTKTAYTTGLNNAQQFAQASLLAVAPELGNVPLDRWAEAVNIIAQSDPARGQQLGRMFQNVSELNQRQQLVSHYNQQVAHQHFETQRRQYAQASDQVLGMSNNEKAQMAEELVSYVGEHGVSREQLMQEARTNLLVHHPAFNALAKDALKYRAMQKAAKPVAQKDLPPVTRPGVSTYRSSADASSQIAALQKQIAGLSGDKAARAAAQLQRLQRKA